jgi:glycosyltransferase involved in cell wall biosynthesis
VRLAGFRSDVREIIAGCDVFVVSSIKPEPLGHSALEAMALGIPVVASACGGLVEVVAHETSGLLVEPGNARALADALMRILGDGDLRDRLGIEGRRRAERIFGLDRHVKTIEDVYESVLAESRGAYPITKP